MFVLGHSAIGSRMARAVRPTLPLGWLVFGTILPDLIDKPLYYGLVFGTGKRGAELGLVSGSRTFGHTFLFLFATVAIAFLRRGTGREKTLAVSWGIATHFVLDLTGDLPGLLFSKGVLGPTIIDAFLFPLRGLAFPISPFRTVRDHLLSITKMYVLAGEIVGAVLWAQTWANRRTKP